MERWEPRHFGLDARAHDNGFNKNLNISAAHFHEDPLTLEIQRKLNELQKEKIETLRTGHVTVGAFSLAVALLIVLRIILDARRTTAERRTRFNLLRNIHPAETFPLVLASGVAIQQIVMVSVQSTSLRDIITTSCRGKAMVTFPAMFLMGYITLVFGIEMALRAFKYERFSPRGKWTLSLCMGAISFMILLTWLPTIAWPMFRKCLGELVWISARYDLLALIILSVLVFSFILLAALISIQLMRTANVDSNERIAASRMCYYLLMAALVYALVIPVKVQSVRKDFMRTGTTTRIAEVALFSSGILIGFFHSFLRANATRMVINPIKEGPSSSASPKQKRPRIRFFGPSDLEMNISGPLGLEGGHRPDSRQGLIEVGPEKSMYDFDPGYFVGPEKPLSPGSMKSLGPVDPTKWPLPPDPAPVADEKPAIHKRNKSSYSLFPTRASEIPRLPATVYSPPKPTENRISKLALRRQIRRSSLGDTKSITDINEAFNFLTKPPPLFPGRHDRKGSTDSSATVQIGLRFSVAPATLAAAKCTAATRQVHPDMPPIIRRDNSETSVNTLGLPIQTPSTISSSSHSSMAFPEPPRTSDGNSLKPPAFPPTSSTQLPHLQPRSKALPATPRSAIGSPPTTGLPPRPNHILSGLRMNPVSPKTPARLASPTIIPRSATNMRSPLGVSSPPPPNGWI